MTWPCRTKYKYTDMKNRKRTYYYSALRFFFMVTCSFFFNHLQAQTLGGSSSYGFLKLPQTPSLSATGGINTSYTNNDIGLAVNNPALLNGNLDAQVNASFNAFFAGIQAYNLAGAYFDSHLQTTFATSVFFINYGQITQTDAAGNSSGNFHPVDYAVQFSAARQYMARWHYGIAAKFIHSAYQQYASSAVAFDIGVLYSDSMHSLSASFLAKNMGAQLKTFTGTKEDLPFDLELGITKKLEKAPLAFSLTLHHVHQFNLVYKDTSFNTNFSNTGSGINKILDHFVLAAHILLSNNLEATVGYNYLRRSELNAGTSGNGVNGFSAGFAAKFRKLSFQYARAYYQKNLAYNQLAVTMRLKELFGLGNL